MFKSFKNKKKKRGCQPQARGEKVVYDSKFRGNLPKCPQRSE
jgi:hypothetical protein